MGNFCEKTKIPKFWTNNGFFGYFIAKIFKDFFPVLIKHSDTCQIPKFDQSCPNFGPKMPYLGILGIEFEKTVVIF